MKKLLLPILLLSAAAMNAQMMNHCASYTHLQQQLQNDPTAQAKIDANEQDAANYQAMYPNGYQTRAVVTIPVVVHVVYGTTAENISATRIYEQIQVLNDDYNKLNSDAVNIPSAWQNIAADCDVQFCLASRDPQGNWTSGIERVSTTVAEFGTDDAVKYTSSGGADAWDRNVYLNLWVCDLGQWLLGYAQFPNMAAATDGVVIHYKYFGKTGAVSPFNKGRTATHEVGHWLNLRHIWGDDGGSCNGSDQCADTPNQGSETYGTYAPGTVMTDACTASAPGYMWCNYMDYTDDGSMYFFTQNQKTRMWAALNGSRSPLLTSLGCVLNNVDNLTLTHMFSVYPSPSNGKVTLDFGIAAPSDYDITVYNTLGEVVSTEHVAMLSERTMQLDLSDQSAGIYFVEVRNSSEKVTRRIVIE